MSDKLHPADPFAIGRHIDGGCSREVYESKHWPSSRVVKVAREGDEDFNRNEWLIWKYAPNELRRFLAPCYAISDDGRMLLMRRTRPATIPELWQFKVPDVLNCDLHRGNLGKMTGKVVVHDYAGWDSKTEAEMAAMLLTIDLSGEYSRPRAINITGAERRQYGLA